MDALQQTMNLLINNLQFVSDRIEKENVQMSNELDALKQSVANNTTVTGSAVTLLQGLKAALDAAIASGDPAQLKALSDQLGSDTQALSNAVAANTPANP